MSVLYNRLSQLCQDRGITAYRMCKDTGVQPSVMTDLKMGRRQTVKAETAARLAAYFGVSVDYLLGNEEKPAGPTADSDGLTPKDRRDIARDLEKLMNELEESGDLMFDGDPMSEEAMDSIRNAMAMALEYAKKVNKEKYTPKKYRKEKGE